MSYSQNRTSRLGCFRWDPSKTTQNGAHHFEQPSKGTKEPKGRFLCPHHPASQFLPFPAWRLPSPCSPRSAVRLRRPANCTTCASASMALLRRRTSCSLRLHDHVADALKTAEREQAKTSNTSKLPKKSSRDRVVEYGWVRTLTHIELKMQGLSWDVI